MGKKAAEILIRMIGKDIESEDIAIIKLEAELIIPRFNKINFFYFQQMFAGIFLLKII